MSGPHGHVRQYDPPPSFEAYAQGFRGEAVDLLMQKEQTKTLTSLAETRINALTRNSQKSNITLVSIPEKLFNHERLSVDLNQEQRLTYSSDRSGNTSLTLVQDTVFAVNREYMAWHGYIDHPELRGRVKLVQDHDGITSGRIMVNDQLYRIRPLDEGVHALLRQEISLEHRKKQQKKKQEKYEAIKEQIIDAGKEAAVSQESTQPSTMASSTQNVLDIAIFYNSDVNTNHHMNSIIAESMAYLNASFTNSQINIEALNPYSGWTSLSMTGDIEHDLEAFTNNTSVNYMMGMTKTDIGVLFIDSNLEDWDGILGVAQPQIASSQKRHVIVNLASESSFNDLFDSSFAHEVGHLFGAEHHPSDSGIVGMSEPWARGHRFTFANQQRRATAVAYNFFNYNFYQPIPHFSDPEIFYYWYDDAPYGDYTGTENRNNAQQIRNTASHVTTLGGPNLHATVDGSIDPYGDGSGTLTAHPTGGSGTYFYEWSTNSGVIGNSKQINVCFTHSGYNIITMKVTCSGGQQYETHRSYFVMSPSCNPSLSKSSGSELAGKHVTEKSETPLKTAINNIYPNPFNPVTQVTISLEEAGMVDVAVYDVLGRRVSTLHRGDLTEGHHHFTFEAGSISSGTYIVRMTAGNQVFTRNITVMK